MLTWLGRFTKDLLWDQSKAQRYITAALFALGSLLAAGGAIPGTGVVVPGLADWSGWGAPIQWLAMFVGAGVKTPGGAVAREMVSGTPPRT